MPAHPTSADSPLHTLDLGGLTLLLKESHALPVVSLDVLVQVGAKDEPPEVAGVAHFIEHLLFRTHEAGVRTDPAERLQRVGGEMNGYTTHDFTCCTVTVAARYLDVALELQSEIFARSPFRQDDIEAERRIILQEIRFYEDNPLSVIQDAGQKRLFGDHPYARQVHGGSRSVSRIRREQIAGFFEANYCREKTIVVAVGDFQAERLAERLAASLKALRSISPPPPSFDDPPPRPQPGFLRIERDLQLTHLDLVFRSVPMGHRDFPALMALSIILGGGRVSRVFRELFERRRLVQTIGTAVPPLKLAGLFSISTTFQPGREDGVRDALKAELRRVRTEPVTEDELALARTKVEASAVFKNETVAGQSFTLGLLACMGDAEYEPRFLAALAALRPADLLEAAQEHLAEESAIELCCGPKARPADSECPARDPVAPTALPVANLPDRGDFEVLQKDKVVKVRLPNQAIVLIREDHDLPLVSLCAMVKAGSRMDPSGKNGLASLTQDMLHRATRWRTAEQLAHAAESVGAEFGGGCSMDVARLEAYGLSRDFHPLVKLFAEVLTAPAFDKNELDSIREHVLTEVRALEDDIENLSSRMISEALFGDHPYSVCPLGTPETLPALTADDLADFYARHYCGRNLVVAIVGNIGWEDAAASVAGALRDLPAGPESVAGEPRFPANAEAEHLKLRRPFASPSVIVGWRIPETVHPDHPALHALSVVLGGPFSSRLWKELRERRGLCYALGADLVRGNDAGVFSVSAATAKRHVVEVRDIIFRHVAELRANPCSEAEMDVARRYIIGAHELAHQGPSAWADLLASYEASGLGWDYDFRYPELVARLSPNDIRQAAERYLPMDRYVLLTISPQGLLGRLLARVASLGSWRIGWRPA